MRIAMSVGVYYALDHLFPQHGCVAHRNENCNVCMCILFPSTTISLNMEWVAHINEICNVCMCILFPWPPIFPIWRGLLREMRIAMSVCVYYSFDHLFPQTWRGLLTEIRIAMSVSVYYSFDHLFLQHGGCCCEKWELQCLHVCIIPLITYFPNMEGVAHRNEKCNVCMCILFPRSRISQNMEGVAHRNKNCNVCVCILFLWSPISPTWRGLLSEMRIAMSVCVYLLL